MSISVMTAVWQHSKASGSGLLVLLAIADFADERGTAFPSITTLAKKSRMSERNVRYVLHELEQLGELSIKRNAGRSGCNLFRINTAGFAALQGLPPETGFPNPCNGLPPPLQPVAAEPSLTAMNRQKERLSTIEANDRGALAATLRELGVQVSPGHPDLIEWVAGGLTKTEAHEAVMIARRHKPAPNTIPARYLNTIILGEIFPRRAQGPMSQTAQAVAVLEAMKSPSQTTQAMQNLQAMKKPLEKDSHDRVGRKK